MGDTSEMMQEGILCESCGIYLDEDETHKGYEPNGVPQQCNDCTSN